MLLAASLTGCGAASVEQKGKAPADAEETVQDGNGTDAESAKATEDGSVEETAQEDDSSKLAQTPLDISIRSHHFYESNEEDYTSLYEASYDEVLLSEQAKAAYPELASALDQYNKEKQDIAVADKDSQLAAAKEQYQASPEMFSAYESKNSVFIRRADAEVLSLQEYGYSYAGGAHGYYGHSGTVFDVKTGKKIGLSEVVDDLPALSAYVAARVKELYPDLEPVTGTMEEAVESCVTGKDDAQTAWTMDPLGITLYFSPYTLGSYADGEQQIFVGFAEKPELFTDSYGEQRGAFGYQFDTWQPLSVDLNGDGAMDRLEVRGVIEDNDYGYNKNVEIIINDRTYTGEAYGFDVQPTLVRNTDGKYFVYIATSEENDWHCLYIFDVNGEQPFKIGEVNGEVSCENAEYAYEEGYYWELHSQLYRPESFYLETRMQTLSTFNAAKPYKVGATGMAEPQAPWYTTSNGIELTSKQELLLDIVDEEKGEAIESGVSIPSGTKFTIWRTDNKSFVDCRLSDGRIARVPVENEDWPQKVNGTDIEEVFEGIIFAG